MSRENRFRFQCLFGTDEEGKIFSETVNTLDVSHHGLRVTGVWARIKPDEVVGVTYGRSTVHFRVRWIRHPGTGTAGQMALVNLSPDRTLWDFPLPDPINDNYRSRDDRATQVRSGEMFDFG